MKPPIRNRQTRSMMASPLGFLNLRFLYELSRLFPLAHSEDLERFAFNTVVLDEECFNLFQQWFGQLVNVVDVGEARVVDFSRDQAIVALGLAVFRLLSLDRADQLTLNETAGKRRRIHQHQDVQRIAVIGFGLWNESEVIGKHHPGRENFFQAVSTELLVPGVLIPAAAGSLDYGRKLLPLLVFLILLTHSSTMSTRFTVVANAAGA